MSIAAARFLVIGALVVPLGLLAAGCGGAKPAPSVASLGTTSTGSESTPSDGAAGGASHPGKSQNPALHGRIENVGRPAAGILKKSIRKAGA